MGEGNGEGEGEGDSATQAAIGGGGGEPCDSLSESIRDAALRLVRIADNRKLGNTCESGDTIEAKTGTGTGASDDLDLDGKGGVFGHGHSLAAAIDAGPVLRAKLGHPNLLCAFMVPTATEAEGGKQGERGGGNGGSSAGHVVAIPPPPGMDTPHDGALSGGAAADADAHAGRGEVRLSASRPYPSLLGFDLPSVTVGGDGAPVRLSPSLAVSMPVSDEDPSQGDWRVQVRAL